MACPEFVDLIVEYAEGSASFDDAAKLEAHVAACADCRVAVAEQRELDARLARLLPRPSLTAAFETRLAARIAAERRAPRYRWLPRVLDSTGYLALAVAGASVIQRLPHADYWISLVALAASAAFSLWATGKALHDNFGHR